jgi:diadenosine tetraphosphate (Ap4A) HIT family hydrolase
LLSYIQHPEQHKDEIVYKDSKLLVIEVKSVLTLCQVIRDKYPKAKAHFLVMPMISISKFLYLTREHLPLLKEMKQRAELIVAEYDCFLVSS